MQQQTYLPIPDAYIAIPIAEEVVSGNELLSAMHIPLQRTYSCQLACALNHLSFKLLGCAPIGSVSAVV